MPIYRAATIGQLLDILSPQPSVDKTRLYCCDLRVLPQVASYLSTFRLVGTKDDTIKRYVTNDLPFDRHRQDNDYLGYISCLTSVKSDVDRNLLELEKPSLDEKADDEERPDEDMEKKYI
jgi:hypothetical protein